MVIKTKGAIQSVQTQVSRNAEAHAQKNEQMKAELSAQLEIAKNGVSDVTASVKEVGNKCAEAKSVIGAAREGIKGLNSVVNSVRNVVNGTSAGEYSDKKVDELSEKRKTLEENKKKAENIVAKGTSGGFSQEMVNKAKKFLNNYQDAVKNLNSQRRIYTTKSEDFNLGTGKKNSSSGKGKSGSGRSSGSNKSSSGKSSSNNSGSSHKKR